MVELQLSEGANGSSVQHLASAGPSRNLYTVQADHCCMHVFWHSGHLDKGARRPLCHVSSQEAC